MAENKGNQVATWTDAADDIAAVMPTALTSTAAAQQSSGRFIVEHGAEVVAGHATVTGPSGGAGGDSDIAGPDASDV